MKKQDKLDREKHRRRTRRAIQWAAWRETALISAFFVLILAAAGAAQWWMA